MAEAIVAEELAVRVRELVNRHDSGDVGHAARRIGTREADLRAILTAKSSQPSLATLSAIVRGYDVDTWWLISGETEVGTRLPADRRVGTLNLLSELGTTLTLQRRLQAAGSSPPHPTDDGARA
jgi:hypothetical protein